MDDEKLVKRLLQGEQLAYREVVTLHQRLMHHVAASIVGPALADEVVQESWLSILRALPKFEGRSSLKTWILTVVGNTAKTRLRKESRSIAVGDAQDVELASLEERFDSTQHWSSSLGSWSVAQPDQLLESRQTQEAIHRVIASLPEKYRAVLVLRELEGLEMEEICKILDLTHSNARVLLHRARSQVWQSLENLGV